MLSTNSTSAKAKTMVALLALTLAGGAVLISRTDASPAGSGSEIRLRARAQAVVNGIEAQLNGDFRSSPTRQRLSGELQNINLDLGTDISFCLDSGGTTTLQATAPVAQVAGVNIAQFELDTEVGDIVPDVAVGDGFEAHQGTDDCTAPLLVSAKFR